MRALIQRVKSAAVVVDNKAVSEINKGILLFVALEENDNNDDFDYIINKTLNLRIFENEEGMFDKSLLDVKGELLIVSQFTLYADTRRGRRPSFTRSMPVNQAKVYFKGFINKFKKSFPELKQGMFQAEMEVKLINDGPVTIMIDSNKEFY